MRIYTGVFILLLAVAALAARLVPAVRPALAASTNTCSAGNELIQVTQVNTVFPQGVGVATVAANYGVNPPTFTLVPNTSVTFTAVPGANGAGGTFDNGSSSKTVVSSATGYADPGPFKANGIASTSLTDYYQVTATLAGATSPCQTYSMLNTAASVAGQAALLSVQTPQFEQTTVGTAFPTPFSVVALDSAAHTLPNATITATVQPATDGAGGAFANGSATATAVTAQNGIATFPAFTANLVAGSYSVQFSAGVAPPQLEGLTNIAVATTTALTANPSGASVVGQPVTLTATVAQSTGSRTPTGTVEFDDQGAAIGGCNAVVLVNGVATCRLPGYGFSLHSFSAIYGGSGAFTGSTSSAVNYLVGIALSSTSITSSAPGGSALGQSVTFTATVLPVAPGAGTPTGAVSFVASDGTPLNNGNAVPLVNGKATVTTSALTLGNVTITGSYRGDGNFYASRGIVQQTVQQPAATVTLSSSANPSNFGRAIAIGVAVGGSGAQPTGTVTLFDGQTAISGALPLANGQASFNATTLAAGKHALSAHYSGDTVYAAAAGSLTQVVTPAQTTTTVTSSGTAAFGRPVTFTATVTNISSGATPTGSVGFSIDGGAPQPGTAPSGSGANATSRLTLSTLTAGKHTVVAVYSNTDDNFAGSSGTLPRGQIVTRARATVAIAVTPDPSSCGRPVTVAVTVSGAGGTPSGTVTLTASDGTALNAGRPLTLTAGKAQIDVSLSCGSNVVLTATYSGDTDFAAATARKQLHGGTASIQR